MLATCRSPCCLRSLPPKAPPQHAPIKRKTLDSHVWGSVRRVAARGRFRAGARVRFGKHKEPESLHDSRESCCLRQSPPTFRSQRIIHRRTSPRRRQQFATSRTAACERWPRSARKIDLPHTSKIVFHIAGKSGALAIHTPDVSIEIDIPTLLLHRARATVYSLYTVPCSTKVKCRHLGDGRQSDHRSGPPDLISGRLVQLGAARMQLALRAPWQRSRMPRRR
jgi:hypothetical protein